MPRLPQVGCELSQERIAQHHRPCRAHAGGGAGLWRLLEQQLCSLGVRRSPMTGVFFWNCKMLDRKSSLLPQLPPHRPSAATKAAYQDKVKAFCATILEVQSRLDFPVGSRGWAYILEGERLIDKDEIDAAQDLINDCRKSGDLPLDICSEDGKRAAENLNPSIPIRRNAPPLSSITFRRRSSITRRSASGTTSTSTCRRRSRSQT